MNEILVEIGLRVGKLVLAGLLGLVIYVVLTGPFGAAGSAQLALESWIAGGVVILLVESGPF